MPASVLFPGADWRFSSPRSVFHANTLDEVVPVLAAAEAETRRGHWAVGFVAYEAAPAFDAALLAHAPRPGLPLAWFGIYDGPEAIPPHTPGAFSIDTWTPGMSRAGYRAAVDAIRSHLAAGDTYQVNYTFGLEAGIAGDDRAWFDQLSAAQPTPYAAYFDLGPLAIASISPELFFRREAGRLTCQPMKGTRARAYTAAEDRRLREVLAASEKDRAENVMIVDMVRNDLGRICVQGTVDVTALFEVTRYPTVWQMTSTITGTCDAPLDMIFGALFPCASVTGAPKVETTRIIRLLEPAPRGVYCGALGWCAPDGTAQFSVGIRTALVDREARRAHYAVGSGVTWYSRAGEEYAECLAKARVLLRRTAQPFDLLETMRLEDGRYPRLAGHLVRLAASAEYFGYPCEDARVRAALEAVAAAYGAGLWRVRLRLDAQGDIHTEVSPHADTAPWRLGLGHTPIDPDDVFLYHKTTRREVYARGREERPDCDDTVLYRPDGRLTETCFGNLVIERDARLITPPVSEGLLPGVMRAAMLETGTLEEKPLTRTDLFAADAVYVINALRGWVPCTLADAPPVE